MEILFLGGMYPAELYKTIEANSKKGLQFAANNFQWSIIKGLEENLKDFSVLTAPFLSTFPFGYKRLFFKGCDFSGSSYKGKCISFINVPIIQTKKKKLIYEILEWYNHTSGKKCIIIYALINDLMSAAIEVKNIHPDLSLCQIVPDLPEFINANKIYRFLGLKKLDSKSIKNNIKFIDSFVVLTPYMVDRLSIGHKPFLVIEGIYDSSSTNIIDSTTQATDDKIVLYTGALTRKYGIIKLLDTFSLITQKDYKLWFCGGGECVEEIEERSKNDARIKYWGLLPTTEVQAMQKKANVLVNPRPSGGEYTKYSFPSKTMEYLASGTPVIMYKLEGVPQEYIEFCFVPLDDSVSELKNTIQKVCTMSTEERNNYRHKAHKFILSQKNHKVQTRKIIDFIVNI
ncbi:MAG: hypothetical protein BGO30_02795 [Bacteroidetes bacterium 41-46]|nr:MAG: hypothetical protein BGO30_02795 [Bacteroidetes bacterium 41-46]